LWTKGQFGAHTYTDRKAQWAELTDDFQSHYRDMKSTNDADEAAETAGEVTSNCHCTPS
jgi:hypothetical protein